MGTEFKIVIYHTDESVAKQAAEKAFTRVAILEKVFSDYEENSEVSWLSDAGKATDVSDELWTVLSYAQEVADRSEGAFDVSVGAVSKLWRKAFRDKEFPSAAAIAKASATVGYQDILMKDRNKSVKLGKEGMRLDFGGIAKGFAVDEAIGWLKVSGIDMYLVDGGGDLRCGMAPPGKAGWEIEVPDKMVNGELTFRKVFYKNVAVATSGDTYRYLENEGKRYSHIIDPRTGYGLTNRRAVTVTAPNCMAADAWATAASVGLKKLLTVDLRNKENIKINIVGE
jgi:thiamine biosynthesis lipoprotein